MELQRYASILTRLSNELLSLAGRYDSGERSDGLTEDLLVTTEQMRSQIGLLETMLKTPVQAQPMKLTYYLPTTEQEQEALIATVKRLFNVDPTITERAVGLDFDFAKMDTLADLLNIQPSQIVKRPCVVFTIETDGAFSKEQTDLLTRPGAEYRRDYDVNELLNSNE